MPPRDDQPIPVANFRLPATRTLIPFRDPWPATMPRFMDIDDNPLPAFHRHFVYTGTQVTLTYDKAPLAPYFVGHIDAHGLKPNFAYQLKLEGKPEYGIRGWGDHADDSANERLGRAARWWDDTQMKNADDDIYESCYVRPSVNHRHTVYGYQFLGDFITDQNGDASLDFNGAHSLHITWQDKQIYGIREIDAGTYHIHSDTAPYYGYGAALPDRPVKLWYERQSGRTYDVTLPVGHYHLRLVVTEESFHSQLGGIEDPDGGYWHTVLGTEGYTNDGHPNPNPANDVGFVIGAPSP